MSRDYSKIQVSDPFGAANDRGLPSVARALDPAAVKTAFRRGLPRLAGEAGQIVVKSIRVIRHKPGKRCVIEYDVRVEEEGVRRAKAILIGKLRARRFGTEAYRLLDALWAAGFHRDSVDGVSVPEPIGVLPELQLWLQRKVPGDVASAPLAGQGGIALAGRIAEAIHKLHRAGVPTDHQHTMADELRILHQCLPIAAQLKPTLASRIGSLLDACDRLGARVPAPATCPIHRDFYPAQVIVEDGRLWLIDFDLYCQGDPALDVGNFLGHMIEESLRTFDDANALSAQVDAMEERFFSLSGKAIRGAVRAYTTLTLARHIYLSTQFHDRASFTERLLELCEERLR